MKNYKKFLFAFSAAALFLAGCSATKLTPGAQAVYVTQDKPDPACKFVGQVTGGQGNAFTGAFTTNRNLQTGAMNDIRNQAFSLGGNYVQIVKTRDQNVTKSSGDFNSTTSKRHLNIVSHDRLKKKTKYNSSQQDAFMGEVVTANVFRCPRDKFIH
jgi:hypothetical protein